MKRQWHKRITAGTVAFILMITTLCTSTFLWQPSAQAAEGRASGVIEADVGTVAGTSVDVWAVGSSANAITAGEGTVARSGEKSLQFTSPTTTQGFQIVESAKITVKANTTYDVSYFVKTADFLGATGYVSVRTERGAWLGGREDLVPFYVDEDFGTDWRQTEKKQFVTDANTTEIIVRFTVHTWVKTPQAGSTLYIDDLAINEVPKNAVNDGSLDASFEKVSDGKLINWTSGQQANGIIASAGTSAHTGKHSLQFTSPSTAQGYQVTESNKVTVKPNTTYDISYYVKNQNFLGATGYVSVRTEDGAWIGGREDLVSFYVTDDFGTDWKKLEGRFTTDGDTTELIVRFTVHSWVQAPVKGATLFIDDLSIDEVPASAANDGSLDESFEKTYKNKLTNWTVGGEANGIVATAGTVAHTGKSSLQFTSPSKKQGYQVAESNVVKVEPNTTYDISYYLKNKNFTGATGYVSVRTIDGEWLGKEDLISFYISPEYGNDWTKLSGQFKTDNKTKEVIIRFTVHTWVKAPVAGGTLFIDDLYIGKAVKETTIIKNPDFERPDLASWIVLPVPFNKEGNADLNIKNQMGGARVQGGQSGDYALRMQADVYGFVVTKQQYDMNVKPNQTYRLTYYVRTENAAGAESYVQLRMLKEDGTGTMGDFQRAGEISGNQKNWKKVTYYFTTAEDQKKLNLELALFITQNFKGNVPAVAYYDNLKLEKVKALSPKANLGFEYVEEDSLRDWTWLVGADSAEEILAADKNDYSWSLETKDVHEGKKAVKLTSQAGGAYAQINSPYQKIKGGEKYQISYWVKLLGTKSSKVSIGCNFTKRDGKAASTEWYWASDNAVNGKTDGWKQVRFIVDTPSDAVHMDIRILVTGAGTTAIIDDVQYQKVVIDNNLNLGFESDMHNWIVSGGDAEIDTRTYHGGKKSIHVTKDATTDTKITSMSRVTASMGQTYLFGGYIKSRNNINTKIRINLNCYDKNGSMMKSDLSQRVMLGRSVPLNGDDKVSDWQRLMIAVPIPDDTETVAFEIVISEGRAEVWVDDLFYRICNLSADETLVDFSDEIAVDSDGKMESWEAVTTKGNVSFSQAGSAPSTYGKLVVEEDSEGYMAYQTDYLLSGDSFDIVFRDYSSSSDMKAVVQYYDYRGKHLEGLDAVATVPASTSKADYTMNVTVPSSTTAKICLGADVPGVYTLEKLDIIEVYRPDASQSWLGRWLWYDEDSLTAGQYATRYFRQEFTLDEEPTCAPLQISVDDNYTVYVNGVEVGSNMGSGQDQWQAPQTYNILQYLKKGKNVIAIEAYNLLSYGGAVWDARVTMKNEETVQVCSNMGEVVTTRKASGKWTEAEYKAENWSKPKEIGVMGVSPWGTLYFDSSLYAENQIEIVSFEAKDTLKTDQTAKLEAVIRVDGPMKKDFPFEVQIYRKNSTKQITSAVLEIVEGAQPSKWQKGENEVVFEMYVPDYLETGNYTLQLSDTYYYLTNENVIDRMFANITVLQANETQELPTSEIKTVKGKPTIYVNGEAKAPLFYLSPAGDLWWDMEKEEEYMEHSETEFYVTNTIYLNKNGNRTDPIWLDADTIDYDTFDRYIYEPLSAEPDALLVVAIGMQAPDWWLDQNPDEVIQIYDSKTGEINPPATRAASFSSESYREDAGKVLEKLIDHMMEMPYASHIVGVKIQDGETQEYMTEGVEDWKIGDFSKASLRGFRKYLKETYKTNKALQEAYHDPDVTFKNVTVPTWDDRAKVWLTKDGKGQTGILDAASNRWTIDYNYYLGKVATDTFLHYAQIIKETSGNKLLAGAYHGYTWAFATPAGTGSTHPAIQDVLKSPYVDFICSPFVYGERDKGENAAYDAMMDGAQAAGKLYILEIDTRSVFETATGNADWDADVGYCYTMEETIQSLKRDIGGLIAKGAGFWLFNMYGGWWYDEQIYDYIKEIKEEMYFNTYINSETASDIAIFVDEMLYQYTSAKDTYGTYQTLYFLFNQQRRNLGTIGAGYDTYNVSDLVNGYVKKDYKINVMLSPYEITEDERAAIEKHLMKDGKILLWIYLPGLSDGKKNDLKNIEKLTGFKVGYENRRGLLNGAFVSGHTLTKGIEDYAYGNDLDSPQDSAGPLPYIDLNGDSKAVELATCVFDDTKTAMAMKDMGEWTSIYSTVMNLPSGFFRNLLKYVDGQIYSDNESDIIQASSAYLNVYSLYGGTRTITLPKNRNYSVYDVYEDAYITLNDNTFTFEMEDNSARLFRLMSAEKIAVLTMTENGHATLDQLGVTELIPGEDLTVHIELEKGYSLDSVKVNGKEVGTEETITLENVQDTQSIVFRTKQDKTHGVFYTELAVKWGKLCLLVLGILAGLAFLGIAVETAVVVIRTKRRNRQ